MKLIFITNARIPTEKAYGLATMKMCEAFAKQGLEVELLCPDRSNPGIKEDAFDYYGVEKNFRIMLLPHIDPVPLDKFLGPLASWLGSLEFMLTSFMHLLFTGFFGSETVLFSNDHFQIFLPSFFSKNIIYEIHDFPRIKSFAHKIYFSLLFKNLRLFLLTNSWKEKELGRIFDMGGKKTMVYPNGIDLKDFDVSETQQECRKKLNLPLDKKIILYTGHLFSWKGTDVLARASQYLPQKAEVYFVGGMENDIREFKDRNSKFNVNIMGRRPHSEIPFWQKAADVLVLPNTAKEDISKYWTSPMKMFEYMTSKRPIAASDLPSIRQVLNEDNAALVEPDNPQALAGAIKKILEDEKFAGRISGRAFCDIQDYAWDRRAENIIREAGLCK